MGKVAKLLTGLAMAAVLTAGGACTASAACDASGSHGGAGKGGGKMVAALGLTDAQKAQIKDISDKYRPDIEPLVKEFFAGKRELEGLSHSEKIDDAAIRAQVAKLSAIGADLAVKRAHALSELRGVLTPEQIQKIKDLKGDEGVDHLLMGLAKRAGKS